MVQVAPRSKPICEGLKDVGDHEEVKPQYANMFEDAQAPDHLQQEDVGEEHQKEQDEDVQQDEAEHSSFLSSLLFFG